MKKYMFIYHGGGDMPDTDEARDAEMRRWQDWMGGFVDKIVDPGAPAGPSQTVSKAGVTHNSVVNPVMGYTLVHAHDIDEALEIARSCPLVKDGGSVEVAEAIPI